MKLKFDSSKPNTATVQFRIDPDNKKKLTALRNYYGVTTGVLIKEMIIKSYESILPSEIPKDPNNV